jgi:hypothetical protein
MDAEGIVHTNHHELEKELLFSEARRLARE